VIGCYAVTRGKGTGDGGCAARDRRNGRRVEELDAESGRGDTALREASAHADSFNGDVEPGHGARMDGDRVRVDRRAHGGIRAGRERTVRVVRLRGELVMDGGIREPVLHGHIGRPRIGTAGGVHEAGDVDAWVVDCPGDSHATRFVRLWALSVDVSRRDDIVIRCAIRNGLIAEGGLTKTDKERAVRSAGYERAVDIISERAGGRVSHSSPGKVDFRGGMG